MRYFGDSIGHSLDYQTFIDAIVFILCVTIEVPYHGRSRFLLMSLTHSHSPPWALLLRPSAPVMSFHNVLTCDTLAVLPYPIITDPVAEWADAARFAYPAAGQSATTRDDKCCVSIGQHRV